MQISSSMSAAGAVVAAERIERSLQGFTPELIKQLLSVERPGCKSGLKLERLEVVVPTLSPFCDFPLHTDVFLKYRMTEVFHKRVDQLFELSRRQLRGGRVDPDRYYVTEAKFERFWLEILGRQDGLMVYLEMQRKVAQFGRVIIEAGLKPLSVSAPKKMVQQSVKVFIKAVKGEVNQVVNHIFKVQKFSGATPAQQSFYTWQACFLAQSLKIYLVRKQVRRIALNPAIKQTIMNIEHCRSLMESAIQKQETSEDSEINVDAYNLEIANTGLVSKFQLELKDLRGFKKLLYQFGRFDLGMLAEMRAMHRSRLSIQAPPMTVEAFELQLDQWLRTSLYLFEEFASNHLYRTTSKTRTS